MKYFSTSRFVLFPQNPFGYVAPFLLLYLLSGCLLSGGAASWGFDGDCVDLETGFDDVSMHAIFILPGRTFVKMESVFVF